MFPTPPLRVDRVRPPVVREVSQSFDAVSAVGTDSASPSEESDDTSLEAWGEIWGSPLMDLTFGGQLGYRCSQGPPCCAPMVDRSGSPPPPEFWGGKPTLAGIGRNRAEVPVWQEFSRLRPKSPLRVVDPIANDYQYRSNVVGIRHNWAKVAPKLANVGRC